MATGQDVSYSGQAQIYRKQQPAGTSINGNTVVEEEVFDSSALRSDFGLEALNGQVLPRKIAFTIAPTGGGNITQISIQVQDNGAQSIGLVHDMDIVLSDAATGAGQTGTTASGAVSITTGDQLTAYVAKKALRGRTDATGLLVFTITDAAKTGFYIFVKCDGVPVPYVSRQLVAGDYS